MSSFPHADSHKVDVHRKEGGYVTTEHSEWHGEFAADVDNAQRRGR